MSPEVEKVVVLVLWVPVFYVTTFLHELGHAICGHLSGLHVTSFGLGTARPLVVTRWRGVRIYVCLQRPFQGLSFSITPQLFLTRWQQVNWLAGGIIAHLLLVAMAASLLFLCPKWAMVWYLLGGVNLLFALTNLLPYSFHVGATTLQSDGALILKILRTGPRSVAPAELFSSLESFRELWQATGDLDVWHSYLVSSAACWATLGDPGRGSELLLEAQSLPFEPVAPLRAYEQLVAAEIAVRRNDHEGADLALAKAEEQFRHLGHEAGLLLSRLSRALLQHGKGENEDALRTLEALMTRDLGSREAPLRAALLASRFECCCDVPGSNPEALLLEYAALSSPSRSPILDLQVFRAAARWRQIRNEGEQAAQAYLNVLSALHTLDVSLTGVNQERFRLAQLPLVAEAQTCLRNLERTSEAAGLDEFFASPEEQKKQARQAKKRRNARILRWAPRLLLFNVTVLLVIVGLRFGELTSWPTRPRLDGAFVLALWLTFFSVVGIPLTLLFAVLGRVLKGVAGQAGKVLLIMTVTPWLLWVVTVLFWIFL